MTESFTSFPLLASFPNSVWERIASKLRFASGGAKQSLASVRSQTEFGNEVVGALALGLFLFMAPVAHCQSQQPIPSAGIEQRLNDKIPLDLVFRDEQGESVMLGNYFGAKPVILVLAYYRCPRLCSLVLNGLVEGLQRIDYEIGKEFTVVTVSIDPREQPELAAAKKASYVQRYGRPGAEAGWHFLTGHEQAIKRLAEAVGYGYVYDAKTDQFGHGSGIMMLTADGTLARYFYGIEYPPRELRFGLEDCSAGKIGSPVGRPLRLLCFTYDPVSGTYTLMTMQLLRLAAVAMVLAIGFFVVRSCRRERLGRMVSVDNRVGSEDSTHPANCRVGGVFGTHPGMSGD